MPESNKFEEEKRREHIVKNGSKGCRRKSDDGKQKGTKHLQENHARRYGEVRKWQATCRTAFASLGEILSPNTLLGSGQKERNSEVKIIEKNVTRARPYCYAFRMTAAEKELIDRKVKASGMSKTDFLLKALSEKPVVNIDGGAEILSELKRQGNNLNQAVKNNYFGKATERELLSCVDLCKETYRKLLAAIGGS